MVLPTTMEYSKTKTKFLLICLISLGCTFFAFGEAVSDETAEVLHRYRRAVQQQTVTGNTVPENVGSNVTLYTFLAGTSRTYVVTNDSAGVTEMFQVSADARLTLNPSLASDSRKMFDFERFPIFQVTVNATNTMDSSDVIILTINIPLTDVNDELPYFSNIPKPFLATMSSTIQPGSSVVYTVTVSDPDTNANLNCTISEASLPNGTLVTDRFRLTPNGGTNPKTFNIVTAGTGLFLADTDYTVKIQATDSNGVGQIVSDSVVIRTGNRPPQFFQSPYSGRIYENTPASQTNWVLEMNTSNQLGIQVQQFQAGNQLNFQLLDQSATGPTSQTFDITLDGNIRRIFNKVPLDYEATQKSYTMYIKVTESGTNLASTVRLDINVLDENDNSPTFYAPQYSTTIREDVPLGYTIITATATDYDSGVNGEVVFSILNGSSFNVKTSNSSKIYFGNIVTQSLLDYDNKPSVLQFMLVATDKGVPPLSSSVPVSVTLLNVNDNPPTFLNTNVSIKLNETLGPGAVVTIIQAIDIDGDNVKFYFEGNTNTSQMFSIAETGQVFLTAQIPKDEIDQYFLKVIAVDDDTCCTVKTKFLTSTATFTVDIVDFNVNKPNFNNCQTYDQTAKVRELSDVGTFVIQVKAYDKDRGENGVVLYRLEPPTYPTDDVFQMDEKNGSMTVKTKFPRPQLGFIQVTVVGRNPPAFPLMEGRCTFRVTIEDINDNPPIFSPSNFEIPVTTSTQPPRILTQMIATDKDVGVNANITYSFNGNDTTAVNGTFSIERLTGIIRLEKSLNSTDGKSYILTVVANDNGIYPGPLYGTATVTISVKVENVAQPQWVDLPNNNTSPSFNVSESELPGYVITTFKCRSNSQAGVEFRVFDTGNTISSESQKFVAVTINNSTVPSMNVALRSSLDYETKTFHLLSVVCQSFGNVVQAPLLTLTINVVDANDQIPEFVGLNTFGRYVGYVPENAQPGFSVLQVSAIDRDTNPEFNTVTFYIPAENNITLFEVRELGNNRADIYTTAALILDRENVSQYSVQIFAQDKGTPPNKVNRFIDVYVLDVNDNPPAFDKPLYVFNVSENAAVGDLVGFVTATDPDTIDQNNGLEFRLASGNTNNAFYILSYGMNGAVRLARKLDYDNDQEPKAYNITVMVFDQYALHNASTVVYISLLDENDNPPMFSQKEYRINNTVVEEDTRNTPQNPFFLVTVNATDGDKGRPQTRIRYRLFNPAGSNVAQLFRVDEVSGNVSLIGRLDRDIPPNFYTVTIEATDEEINPLTNSADVLVYPLDINDNHPEFQLQYLLGSVYENSANRDNILTVGAIDIDLGNNATVRYRIATNQPDPQLSAMFTVGELGSIGTTSNVSLLDRESIEQVLVVIEAYDLGTPMRLSSTATSTISVLDVNDNSPYFEKSLYSTSMSEAQTSGRVMTVPCIDRDVDPKNRQLIFNLKGNGTEFFIVQTSGTDAVISVVKSIDYELGYRLFTFILNVTDGEKDHVNQTTVQIRLLDANDNPPVFDTPVQSINLTEEEEPGKEIAVFHATDADEGLNAEIVYSVVRASDPLYEIYINSSTGVVTTRKKLDREKHERMTVFFIARDKGEIPLSSTATLSIFLIDINDNAPQFREKYQPVLQENVDYTNYLVQEILAFDPDTAENGPPFGFSLPQPCTVLACQFFQLTFDAEGDNKNGRALVYTSSRFDREQVKQYFLPIVMWDRNGKGNSLTATNTLTITIGDENDNNMAPGNQDILVYNYEGQFTSNKTLIGRVYANDPDDWDLPDKTFRYLSPDNLKNYFDIDSEDGMITMEPGLAPNFGKSPYQFKVNVYDKKYDKTVTCTVSVVIMFITDEAIRKSSGVRLGGITADDFIKPGSGGSASKYQQFRQSVASMLGYSNENSVEIVSVAEGEDYLDVRFSAHASPYVNPSQGESAIMLNLEKFKQQMGLTNVLVPINLCMEEIYDDGCYNNLVVTGQPELVNANGTSFVMIATTLKANSGCVDSGFPDPVECRGDYCYNGGTCIKDDWGKLSCACNAGFDGPRCQQRRHSFDGTNTAFYQGLSACSAGRTSIDFITQQEDGLIMYSGPITNNEPAKDYLILELKGGYPSIRLSLGGAEANMRLTGMDSSGTVRLNKLNDGQWHHIDIDRDDQEVTLTVDRCQSALASSNGTVQDWSPCQATGQVPGPDVLLNVQSLLQLGGKFPNASFPTNPTGVGTKGFSGCLRNLVHNTKLYDLYYKTIPGWNSGTNGCPREEAICGQNTPQPVCGRNATCDSRWQPDQTSCRCLPGWYGDKCSQEAPTRDLRKDGFFSWNLKSNLTSNKRTNNFQMMFRTRQTTGPLIALSDSQLRPILLQIIDGKLTLSYDMGEGTAKLNLSSSPVNTGQWTTVRVERYGNEFLLMVDGGEGRNFNYHKLSPDLKVLFDLLQRITVGVADVNGANNTLQSTCLRDIRFNDQWLPMATSQNSDAYAGASLTTQPRDVGEGCVRDDCAGVTCDSGLVCYPLWEAHDCRCATGSLVNKVCVVTCNPNPCLNGGICNLVNSNPVCTCAAGWEGTRCNSQQQVNVESGGLGGGEIAGIVIAILILLILLILLLIFLLTRKRSEKEKILEIDPDDDFTRENVMYYNEEGAGEEDHAAYDITLLRRPANETNFKPMFLPPVDSETRRQNAPTFESPNIYPSPDRPDVGSFIKDRLRDAEDDDPNADSTREFNFEGGESEAGSLSSLNTSSSGGSQDYDYLSDWGPKFAKLADMYGAGQHG